MRGPTRPQISAPLSSAAFLQASHFQLGFDRRRPEGSTVVSPYRTDYPPRWGSHRRQPILPSKCAEVLNQDMGGPWDAHSETFLSYPPRPLQPMPEIRPPTSHLQMHTDPRQRAFTSVTRESYPYPPGVLHVPPNRVDKWDDCIPSGDKDKLPLPASLYQQSYAAHPGLPPVAKAPSQHLGSDSTMRGDGDGYFSTSYQSQFTGNWGPRAQRCSENVVSVVFGDPRYHQDVSEQKHAYTTPLLLPGQRYDPTAAAMRIQQTSIRPGDGQQSFSTIMSESYPWKDPGPPYVLDSRKNGSSILQDGPDDKENVSTHRFYYREPTAVVHPPACDPLRGQAKVRLGDDRFAFFSTTHQSGYQPPPETPRAAPKKNDLMASNISFDYHASGAPTTSTQDMFVPHRQPKHQLTEEDLQKVKYSHLTLPWGGLRWFSTEQKDAYTDKYGGPVSLAVGDFQRSSVPLGTLPVYQHRKTAAP